MKVFPGTRMKRKHALASWTLCLAMGAAHAGQVQVAPTGRTVLAERLNGHRVEVVIQVHRVDVGVSATKRLPRSVSCTYSRFPCSVLDEVALKVDGRGVVVPRSAFVDLGDVDKATLATAGNQFVLVLEGGDASEAYIAKVRFGQSRVAERAVYSAMETDAPLERTRYFEVESDDK